MKLIGIIGGMSWESTQYYYKILNQHVQKKLGGYNSAEILLYSINYAPIKEAAHQNNLASIINTLSSMAKLLEDVWADFLILTANTIHKIAPDIESKINIPLLHIVDPTATAIRKAGFHKIGLLGTQITMEEDFYKDRLHSKHNIEALIPDKSEREYIQRVISEELIKGKILDESKKELLKIIDSLKNQGVEGIILGCTELPLLVHQTDTAHPSLFDTARLHAEAAAEYALS